MNEEGNNFKFEQIEWETLDISAVVAFYDRIDREAHERALLLAPVEPHLRDAWRRRCISDFGEFKRQRCVACGS